jgi:predicted DNA-binding transcriptional regulator YafY
MSPVEKILILVSLLNHRPYVTIDKIRSECRISERTAYRYINTISEANIPVFYDKDVRGYRLNLTGGMSINDLRLSESILVVFALKLLARRVNDEYKEDIENIARKITTKQSVPIEDILRSHENQTNGLPEMSDYSELISSLMITTAITCNRRIQLTTDKGDNVPGESIDIEQPLLRFQKSWKLVGKPDDGNNATALSQIRKVSIT